MSRAGFKFFTDPSATGRWVQMPQRQHSITLALLLRSLRLARPMPWPDVVLLLLTCETSEGTQRFYQESKQLSVHYEYDIGYEYQIVSYNCCSVFLFCLASTVRAAPAVLLSAPTLASVCSTRMHDAKRVMITLSGVPPTAGCAPRWFDPLTCKQAASTEIICRYI